MSSELQELERVARGGTFRDYSQIRLYIREFTDITFGKMKSALSRDSSAIDLAFKYMPSDYGFPEEEMDSLTYIELASLIRNFERVEADPETCAAYTTFQTDCLRKLVLKSMETMPAAALFGNMDLRAFYRYIMQETRHQPVSPFGWGTAGEQLDQVAELMKKIDKPLGSETSIRQVLTDVSQVLGNSWGIWTPIRRYEERHKTCGTVISLLLITSFETLYPEAFDMDKTVRKLKGPDAGKDEDLWEWDLIPEFDS